MYLLTVYDWVAAFIIFVLVMKIIDFIMGKMQSISPGYIEAFFGALTVMIIFIGLRADYKEKAFIAPDELVEFIKDDQCRIGQLYRRFSDVTPVSYRDMREIEEKCGNEGVISIAKAQYGAVSRHIKESSQY